MAVDFSLLPKEQALPDDGPSRLVWSVIFLVLATGIAVGIVMLWPENLPTQGVKFWCSLALFPVGIPTVIVLRRYSQHEARKLDVIAMNSAVREYNERVFHAAKTPLALIGMDYCFSVDRNENRIDGIRGGAVALPSQNGIARDAEPVKARWLIVSGVELQPGKVEDDEERHRKVLKWLFSTLIDNLSDKVQQLPGRLELSVRLITDAMLEGAEVEGIWLRCWKESRLRRANIVSINQEPMDLGMLDNWLDQLNEGEHMQARLVVGIQLNRLLSGTPASGTTEAGVAVLLVPNALANRYQLIRMANLHRPVRASMASLMGDAMMPALKWADIAAEEIAEVWQTGLSADQSGKFREQSLRLGLEKKATDLDQTVGNAGVAAPWLALACAAGTLSVDCVNEIVLAARGEEMDCVVLRRANDGQGEECCDEHIHACVC